MTSIIFFIGRITFGGFFLYNAYGHFKNHAGMAGYAKMKGVPMPKFSVILGGIMLLLGGLAIVFNVLTILGLILLVVFLIPTTFIMHKFWKETDPNAKMIERITFAKNIAIIGALLMLIVLG